MTIKDGVAQSDRTEFMKGSHVGGGPLIAEIVDVFTEEQLQMALVRLEHKMDTYIWLQSRVQLCDVSTDKEFQRKFSGFYRVRRGSQWIEHYFCLMQSSKPNGIDFPNALQELHRLCGQIEASFSSKLVATLDPSKPVIDKFVLKYFGIRLPRRHTKDRESKTIELYRDLCDKYSALTQCPTGKLIREAFDRRYPDLQISELKKLDFVLWQLRS
jgi:hypothetical protein